MTFEAIDDSEVASPIEKGGSRECSGDQDTDSAVDYKQGIFEGQTIDHIPFVLGCEGYETD